MIPKEKEINKYVSVIFLLAKNKKLHRLFLQIETWNIYNTALWYGEFFGVVFCYDFVDIAWVFRPFLENEANVLCLLAYE